MDVCMRTCMLASSRVSTQVFTRFPYCTHTQVLTRGTPSLHALSKASTQRISSTLTHKHLQAVTRRFVYTLCTLSHEGPKRRTRAQVPTHCHTKISSHALHTFTHNFHARSVHTHTKVFTHALRTLTQRSPVARPCSGVLPSRCAHSGTAGWRGPGAAPGQAPETPRGRGSTIMSRVCHASCPL